MTFLNPAVLIGLLAASIPVIIHLLNLKKLKNIEFSTLMFLKELQKNKIRKIKLKQWLLLLLRVLIIVFIILSFARPTLQGLNISGVTSAAKTTSVFLIDNSFSMSVIDQKGSFLNQAKDLAEKIIMLHQNGDEVFVNFLASDSISNINVKSVDFLNSFKADNISLLKPDMKKYLISAAELVNKSKNFNREIFLFSDFQKNLFKTGQEKSDLSELFNNHVKIYSILFRKEEVFNLSIDNVSPENQIIQKRNKLNFLVTITNHSRQNFQNRVLSLFINNKRVAQKSFNINANETQKINIETTLYSEGQLNIHTEIENDDIESDNYYYLALNVPDKISILIIRNESSNPDYIKLALQTLPGEKIKIEERDLLRSSTVEFTNFDVILLISDYYENINKIKNYVEQGGALVVIPTSKINFNNFNSLINSLGIGTLDGFISNDNKVSLLFDNVDYEHPILKDLFINNQQKKLDSPIVTQFLKNSALRGTAIITLSDNSKFLIENKIGKGKIFLFNSAFSLEWNDFPIKSIFAPLIVKTVLYLSQKDFSLYQLYAGDVFLLDLNKINSPRIIIKRPDGTEDYFQMKEINSKTLQYQKTNLAGIYNIIANDKIITAFSVNHHQSESELDYLSKKDFENFLENLNFKGKFIEIKSTENPIENINQSRFGTELWKLFILLALITAIIEMIISRNNKKEIQSIKESL